MAHHAISTPMPAAERPLSVWRIRGLMDYARAAVIAVDTDEQMDALFRVEADLWQLLDKAPIKGANDARGKLGAVLQDLIERDEIDDLSAGIVRQVIRWLDGVVLS